MSKPLFFQKRFLPLWMGQSFGALADNMNRQVLLIGIPFGYISLAGFTKGDAAVPLIGALFPIAMLIGSMFGGQLAEKYETSMMFRRTKLVEVVLMGMAAMGLISGQGWFVVAALFGMGLQSAFFNPVRQAAMPKYLATDELIRGNGLCNAGLYACILLGYGIGGWLIAEPGGALKTGIVLFTFSLIGFIAVLFAPLAPGTNPELKIDWSAIKPTIAMFRFTFGEEKVVRPLMGITLFYFISTYVTVLLPIYGRDTLGADETATTIIMLLFAVGAGIGALIAASMSKGHSGLGFSTMGVSISAVSVVAVYLLSLNFNTDPDAQLVAAGTLLTSPSGLLLSGFLCLTSIGMGMFLAPLQAAIQRRAPGQWRARILATGNMLFAIAALLGSLAVLLNTQIKGLRPEHGFIGVAALLFCVAGYMVWRRNHVPEGLFDEHLGLHQAPVGVTAKL